jgi:hypothetical protein
MVTFHVRALDGKDPTSIEINLPLKEKLARLGRALYLTLGVNWEMIFQLTIPLVMWLIPQHQMIAGVMMLVISSYTFGKFHN